MHQFNFVHKSNSAHFYAIHRHAKREASSKPTRFTFSPMLCCYLALITERAMVKPFVDDCSFVKPLFFYKINPIISQKKTSLYFYFTLQPSHEATP